MTSFPPHRLRVTVGLLALTMISGCNAQPEGHAASAKVVTKAEFEAAGKRWPLTADTAKVGCNDGLSYYVDVHGTRYALNGFAMSHDQYADLKPVWLEDAELNAKMAAASKEMFPNDPAPPKIWISIGDLMNAAKSTC